jgi:hypothetical protein
MAKQEEARNLERTPSTDFEPDSLPPPLYTDIYGHSYDAAHDPETVLAGAEGPYHIRGEYIITRSWIKSADSQNPR